MELTQEQIELEILINRKNAQISLLEDWFNNFFEKQLIQSIWQLDFKVSEDKYFFDTNGNPLKYESIDSLQAKGEEVRIQIKSLRQEVIELNNKARKLNEERIKLLEVDNETNN